jgi:cation diffusion facilitator family transporter
VSATAATGAPPVSAPPATAYACLSIAAGLTTLVLKFGAYHMTGSIGLLSDAVESIVNILAALVALWALTLAKQPADEEHAFGHSKAEYFASGFEGLAILGAAVSIALAAWGRIQDPQPLTNVWTGLGISLVATGINGGVALLLLRAGKRLSSITLRADAHHLFTDVWTSGGVLVGVVLVKLTGWLLVDPIVALVVATNIVWMAAKILLETGHGLLDAAISMEDRQNVNAVLEEYRDRGVMIHAVRTRVAGRRRFLEMHVLVPGIWTVQKGHDLCEEIEAAVGAAIPYATVLTHLEPFEDPISWNDQSLDGREAP